MYEFSHTPARTRIHIPTFLLLVIQVLIFHLKLYQCEQFIHMCYYYINLLYYINLQTKRLVFFILFCTMTNKCTIIKVFYLSTDAQ